VSADRPRDVPGRPGDPGPELPGDLFEDIVSGEPGLSQLFGVLTSGPTPDELSGANAALAMFQGCRPPATTPGPGPRASKPTSIFNARPARRLATLTVTLAAAAGFAVAAYTSTLPAPIQHAAYRVLGFAGIPDTHHGAGGTAGALHPAGPGPAHGTPGAGAQPSAPASAQPGASASAAGPPAGQAGLSVAAASGRITSDGSDTFTGQLSGPGQAVAGVSLRLEERVTGQLTWRVVGSAVTDAAGGASVTAPGLTRNAWFRFAGSGSELSGPVLVVVVPPVSASLIVGPGGRADVLTVSSPLASPGDVVVLQVWSGTRWRDAAARDLNGSDQVTFMVRAPGKAQQYRAVLVGTADHGTSVSATVQVPSR
jgi:hypothetical protein